MIEGKSRHMRFIRFLQRALRSALFTVVGFIRDLFNNLESVIILALASVGACVFINELPFWIALPIWIEAPMAIGIISIMLISTLIIISDWRGRHARSLI